MENLLLYVYMNEQTGIEELYTKEVNKPHLDYRATMIGYKTEEPLRRYDGIYVLISDVVQTSDTNQAYHIIQEQGYEQVYFPEEVKNAE